MQKLNRRNLVAQMPLRRGRVRPKGLVFVPNLVSLLGAEQNDRSIADAGIPSMSIRASALRVLVVDACPINQLLTDVILSRWGVSPEIAFTADQAVCRATSEDYDLILIELQIPLTDGLAVCGRIRRLGDKPPSRSLVPVVAYISSSLATEVELLNHAGISDVLTKPCDVSSMGDCLQRWCMSNSPRYDPEVFAHNKLVHEGNRPLLSKTRESGG